MTPPAGAGEAGHGHSEVTLLGDSALDLMAGLIFELAAQVHEERAARLALQAVLLSTGALDRPAIAAAAAEPGTRAEAQAGLDRSLASLLRVLGQRDDARAPLADDSALARASERRT